MRAPIDKIPGHDIPWNCTGEEWLYPGGNSLNDEHKFKNQFIIKTIPHQSFLRGTCRAGELLNQGIEQMNNLGDYLQSNYKSLLSTLDSRRSFSFRSTYTNRCLASIQTVAQKLLPGEDPVDVFVANEELESLVPNSYLCPKLGSLYRDVQTPNSTFSKKMKIFNNHLNHIKNISNITVVPHWSRIGELLITRHCANQHLPGKFTNEFMAESANLLVDFYMGVMNLTKGRSFSSGLLLSDIYLDMRDYLSGAKKSQFTLICGHTLTIVSLLASLNETVTFPEFGKFVAFEVLEKNENPNSHLVRILLNGEVLKTMEFKEFEKMVLQMRPKEEECGIRYPFLEKDKGDPGIKLLHYAFS
ncbi:acid phosphatase [Histomonas meleagridis]|uniref:acid phosphatase n=1 Tax=Histomonas meleagridis TaxID=135588 RepID=UPI00355A1BE7|nr:acid phosphatase [Histomonas meleagridis]KAH0799966.1 acid phosphatase [Histomonas meleagridis]